MRGWWDRGTRASRLRIRGRRGACWLPWEAGGRWGASSSSGFGKPAGDGTQAVSLIRLATDSRPLAGVSHALPEAACPATGRPSSQSRPALPLGDAIGRPCVLFPHFSSPLTPGRRPSTISGQQTALRGKGACFIFLVARLLRQRLCVAPVVCAASDRPFSAPWESEAPRRAIHHHQFGL